MTIIETGPDSCYIRGMKKTDADAVLREKREKIAALAREELKRRGLTDEQLTAELKNKKSKKVSGDA